jgi:hypothetical protein
MAGRSKGPHGWEQNGWEPGQRKDGHSTGSCGQVDARAREHLGTLTHHPGVVVVRQHALAEGHQQPEGLFLTAIEQEH